jgi:hypothetical protein
MNEQMKDTQTRMRLSKDVDLSKADPNCLRCTGGIVRYEVASEQQMISGSPILIPVICQCVSKGGGVKADKYDKTLDSIEERLNDGTFAEFAAKDILRLPTEQKESAIKNLREIVNSNTNPSLMKAYSDTLKIIESKEM